MTNLIDNLIQSAHEEIQQKEIEQKRKFKLDLTASRKTVWDALGDFGREIEPYVEEEILPGRYSVGLKYYVKAEKLELAPFVIVYNLDSPNGKVLFSRTGYAGDWMSIEQLGEFLRERRHAFPEWREKKVQSRIDELTKKLNYGWPKGTNDPEEATKAAAELTILRPEETDRWNELLARWDTYRERHIALEQEKADLEQQKERDLKSYRQAYQAYLKEREQILEQNHDKVVTELQVRVNQPINVWELEYARMAFNNDIDTDEGCYLDTNKVYVFSEEPDERGYWQVLERGRIVMKRIFNPVAISGPQEIRPTDELYGTYRRFYVADAGLNVYYGPLTTDIQKMVMDLNLNPLPNEPELPETLDWYEIDRIKQLLSRGDEIPF